MAAYHGKAVSGNSVKQNTGVIVNGGNSDTRVTTPGIQILGAGSSRSTAVTDNTMVDKAVSGNALAKSTAGSYQIVNYSPSTLLAPSYANKGVQSSYQIRTNRIHNPQPTSSGGFYYATGKLIQGYPPSGSLESLNGSDPTRANQGKSYYMAGAANPTSTSYSARTI